MKKIDLGQALGILANVGVIAGIIFLGVELRQNNDLLSAQASYNRSSMERQRRYQIAENSGGIVDIIIKERSDEPLNADERLRYEVMASDLLDSLRWQFAERQAGRLPEDYINLREWRIILRENPGIADRIAFDAENPDPAFIQFVEENIADR